MTAVSSPAEGVTLRQAQQADLLDVFRIETASFSQPWPFAAFEQFLGEPGFLVAVVDGVIVGYVVSDVTPNYGRDIGHVKDIAVHPEHRGDGLGRHLLTESMATLLVGGASVVKLEVREGNEPALTLYRDVGFQPVRRVPGYYQDGEAALVMVVDAVDWRMSRNATDGA